MHKKKLKRILSIVLAVVMLSAAALPVAAGAAQQGGAGGGVGDGGASGDGGGGYSENYKSIAGVTEEEIAAIDELRRKVEARGYPLKLGNTRNTEAFIDVGGEIRGFTPLFCRWLTELLGIPFETEIVELTEMLERLRSGEIDFGVNAYVEERMREYHMTEPIIHRTLKIMRMKDSVSPHQIERTRQVRYAFHENSIQYSIVSNLISSETFEPRFAENYDALYHLLESGEADAMIAYNTSEASFDDYGGVIVEDFLPLTVIPMSMSTGADELEPILSVVTKAIADGAYEHLIELHRLGYQEYLKDKLLAALTDEEKAWMGENPVIPMGAPHMVYPVAHYNADAQTWEGVAFDILREIEALTGLEFHVTTPPMLTTVQLTDLLEAGEIFMLPVLYRTPEREDVFIWPETSYMPDAYALISKYSTPNVELVDIPFQRVGMARGSAFQHMFMRWFPNALYAIEYHSTDAAFLALERGEVDFVLATSSRLTALTNYYELSDYKANYLFGQGLEARFGFNKNQTTLVSIFNKALPLIETDRIVNQWMSKTYNIEYLRVREQRPWLIAAVVVFAAALVIVLFILRKFRLMNDALLQREKLLEALNRSATLFLSKSDKTFVQCMGEGVLPIARTAGVHRMSVWRHIEKPDGQIYAQQTYLWDKDGGAYDGPIDEPMRGEQLVSELAPRWLEPLQNGEPINAPSSEYPEMGLLRELGVVSVCVTPIIIKNTIWGYGFFEDREKERYFDERIVEFFRSASYIFASAIIQDETMMQLSEAVEDRLNEIRKTEIAEESNKAKSRFLASMSHEIRTPMNSIMGFAELARDYFDIMPPQVNEYIENISESAGWLLSVINDILDVSKIESGKMELEHVPFDIQKIIAYCESIAMPKALEKGLVLKKNIDLPVDKWLLGDPVRLRQALINLLSNAVKFTDKGEVEFTAAAEDIGGGKAKVYFEVKDTGIGMSEEAVSRIFDPFSQADNTITRRYGGTGLGLTICKNIIEMMGGSLYIDSRPGVGSKFSVSLTFDTTEKAEASSGKALKRRAADKRRFIGDVLVCEDNIMNKKLIVSQLRKFGLSPYLVENGAEALEVINERKQNGEKPFDLILMDIYMPVMGGMEAATKISQLGTETPVVALTANVMSDDLEAYKKSNMVDYLGKPFTSDELRECLAKYLEADDTVVLG